jgi:hypothetical protein
MLQIKYKWRKCYQKKIKGQSVINKKYDKGQKCDFAKNKI